MTTITEYDSNKKANNESFSNKAIVRKLIATTIIANVILFSLLAGASCQNTKTESAGVLGAIEKDINVIDKGLNVAVSDTKGLAKTGIEKTPANLQPTFNPIWFGIDSNMNTAQAYLSQLKSVTNSFGELQKKVEATEQERDVWRDKTLKWENSIWGTLKRWSSIILGTWITSLIVGVVLRFLGFLNLGSFGGIFAHIGSLLLGFMPVGGTLNNLADNVYFRRVKPIQDQNSKQT